MSTNSKNKAKPSKAQQPKQNSAPLATVSLSEAYRPYSFDFYRGHGAAIQPLLAAFERRQIYSTILITGPSGIGKTTLARLIAKTVNDGNLADVTEVNAAGDRGIDDVRQLIEESKTNPLTSNFRVIILDEVHGLTPQAKQILLKPLENPSPKTIWILCTTEPIALPPTLLRRAHQIHLTPLGLSPLKRIAKDIAEREGLSVSLEDLELIAQYSSGSPAAVYSIMETYRATGSVSPPHSTTGQSEDDLVLTFDFLAYFFEGKARLCVASTSQITNTTSFLWCVKGAVSGLLEEKSKAVKKPAYFLLVNKFPSHYAAIKKNFDFVLAINLLDTVNYMALTPGLEPCQIYPRLVKVILSHSQ